MVVFLQTFFSEKLKCIPSGDYYNIGSLKRGILLDKIEFDDVYVIKDGRLVFDDDPVLENAVYQIVPRLLGGKGGFGSMLRAIGAQIEKTTNREACRDLSGRRMRDVKNEKELKEWLAKQAERERQQQQQKEERIARRRTMLNHKFDDPMYDKQKSLVAENQIDALQKGLQKVQHKMSASATATATISSGDSSGEEQGSSLKRKNWEEDIGQSTSKKFKTETEWLGIDVEKLSELESEEEENNGNAYDSNASSSDHSSISDVVAQNDANKISHSNGESQQDVKSLSQTNNKMQIDSHIIEKVEKKHGLLKDLPLVSGQQSEECSVEGTLQKENNTLEANFTNIGSDRKDKTSQDTGPMDLEAIDSPEELEAFGLERLKAELMSRGLKCGGTIQERAKRLFSVKGLTPDQYDPFILAKPANAKQSKKK